MGLPKQVAKMILCEHSYKPITGNVLMIGKQTVSATEAEIREYMRELNLPARDVTAERDGGRLGGGADSVTDQGLFSLFTDAKFSVLDISDYEGADIILDMNNPIPEHLKGKFDFIYDGGCMDNLFNPAQFIANCVDLLREGGRILHLEFGSLWRGAYLMYSGDWFHDYYAINQFEDCKVYFGKFRWDPWAENWAISQLSPFRGKKNQRLRGKAWVSSAWPHVLAVIAEKGPHSTARKMPIQMNYRPKDADWDTYEVSARRFVEIVRYPNGFGQPTKHALNLLQRLREIIRRPILLTRSNLKFRQRL